MVVRLEKWTFQSVYWIQEISDPKRHLVTMKTTEEAPHFPSIADAELSKYLRQKQFNKRVLLRAFTIQALL